MKTSIKDITIIYSLEEEKYIEDIKRIIENNYSLIHDSLDGNYTIDLVNNVGSFYAFFRKTVTDLYTNESILSYFKIPIFAPCLYLATLTKKCNYTDTDFILQDKISGMSDEMLSSFTAFRYFEKNGSFNDFIEYLKVKDNEEFMFKWLEKEERWDAYNLLLKVLHDSILDNDDTNYKLMEITLHLWIDNLPNKAKNLDNAVMEFQYMEPKDFDNLFIGFLNYINAPEEWKDKYNHLKESNLIIIDSNHTECFEDEDGIYKISIPGTNCTKYFCDFVHEFIHYITINQNGMKKSKLSISEVPSIFFERIAAIFLKGNGCEENILDKIKSSREYSNYFAGLLVQPIMSDLLKYYNTSKVTREDKISFLKKQIEIINETRKKMLSILNQREIEITNPKDYEEIELDIESEVDNECDRLNNSLLRDGILVINGYQYLLATYLADVILNQNETISNITPKMIDLINNFKTANINDILTLFNIDINAKLDEESAKKLTKKVD